MIRKFISRLLKGGKSNKLDADGVLRVPLAQHGISRDYLSEGSLRTIEALQKKGFQAFVVGGAIRDLIAGIPPKDFDVATDATPEEVRQCFRRAHIIGRRFRIVHVYQGREIVEVTTFRGPHDNEEHKDEHGRVLRDNIFGTQAEDAARRDFTVNALYYDPATQTVHDYHNGVADLKHKTLRMIGDPEARYREDPIRMLRAVRLANKLGLTIDAPTLRPIGKMGSLLQNVPTARLLDEMLKLLMSGHAVRCVEQLRDEGLHHGLLPLLDVILAQPGGERFIQLALNKTDLRVQEGKPVSPSFLFATLLWQETLNQWKKNQADGEKPLPALMLAMDRVLDRQGQQLAITRRIAGDIKDIWSLQARFLVRNGKKPWTLIEHLRFKAAYDFLLLRSEAGENDDELPALADWWTRFFFGEADERQALQAQLAPEAAANKKRRRRKRSSHAGSGGGSSDTSATE